VQNPCSERGYWQVVEAKSAPFFAAAMQTGALLGGASPTIASQIYEFGSLYGEIIQIHDDLQDSMTTPAGPDWTGGRWPLPLLFAVLIEHPERERFLELRPLADDPERLAEAQEILIHCGAVSYCIDQLLRRNQKARQMLEGIPLSEPQGLQTLLEEMIAPVGELFKNLELGDVQFPPD
jgi:geranylgeranyl pyrophosphate synthase